MIFSGMKPLQARAVASNSASVESFSRPTLAEGAPAHLGRMTLTD